MKNEFEKREFHLSFLIGLKNIGFYFLLG